MKEEKKEEKKKGRGKEDINYGTKKSKEVEGE